jgi:hypothetical protein
MLKNQHLTKNPDPQIGAFLVFGAFLAHETQVPAASGNESQQLDGCRRSPAAAVHLSGAARQRSAAILYFTKNTFEKSIFIDHH